MKVLAGVDIVEVARIEKILRKRKDAFLNKILSPEERWMFQAVIRKKALNEELRGALYLAGVFAAKEALMKMLGTGGKLLGRSRLKGEGISFREIIILHNERGKPYVVFDKDIGKASKIAEGLGIKEDEIEISITHERKYAVAIALCCSQK